jgi:carboxyl-terminal processing protease
MRRVGRNALTGLLVLAAIAAVFFGGYYFGSQGGPFGLGAGATGASAFDELWTVRGMLERSFIGDIPSDQKQAWGAAHGLVAAYGDPYTVFVEPAPREMERDELRGHFGGIGAYLGRDDQGRMVVTVMRDKPAARAGVQDKDVLLAVDDTEISATMTVEEVVAQIRGDESTQVRLKLLRPPATEPFTVTVTRERVDTPTVEWRVLDAERRLGYARIAIFGERTAEELQKGIRELDSAGVRKLVLDLRGNGGGLVDAATEIASQFIKEGNILREVKRGGQERFYPVTSARSAAQDWEIVVLVDGGTASASEIVAGALRDHGRADLIGEKTYGKGSVQEVHEFSDGSSLHVTVARWLTPDRHQIDGTGLDPDVEVGVSEDDRKNGRDPQLARAQAWLAGDRAKK